MRWSFVASVESNNASERFPFVKNFARTKIESIEASSPYSFFMEENLLLRIKCFNRSSASKKVGGKYGRSLLKNGCSVVRSLVCWFVRLLGCSFCCDNENEKKSIIRKEREKIFLT